MQKLKSFKELLDTPKKIVVTTHYKPDADALGSSLGLASYLTKKGHEVHVISPSDYPEFLNWMDGEKDVIDFEAGGNEEKSEKLVGEADLIFCLDFNCLYRINELGDMVGESNAVKVLIDHHLEPERFADYEFWSTQAAATAELVYKLIVDLGDRDQIDASIAECLYAGIMTDTGQFKHPNTTKNVHLVTADLIELGADIAKVGRYIYDNNSLDRLKFTGYALNNKLKVIKDLRTAYFWISSEDLKKYNSKTGDTEGLVNYALSLKGVVFSAVIIERPDTIRISLRSKGDFSVNDFAKEHFNGGGHPNAAGGISDLSLQETVDKFERIIKTYKKQLNKNFHKTN
ncbi:MAG: bifunctional oligoribonuclease/PAP phosphatase NrnA [Cytophagales bacterium]|nr:bifunctional oligoribonuclease/PAP phosphatase NrnA [Cytophagales bacterium]